MMKTFFDYTDQLSKERILVKREAAQSDVLIEIKTSSNQRAASISLQQKTVKSLIRVLQILSEGAGK